MLASHFSFRDYLKICLVGALSLAFLFYVHYQARNLLAGPEIALSTEVAPVQTARTVALSGLAQNIVSLHMNGREIFTDEAGNFSESLVLEDGYTIMTLTAQDRFGRSTSLTKAFVYTPAS